MSFDFSDFEKSWDEIVYKDKIKNIIEKEIKSDVIINENIDRIVDITQQYYDIDDTGLPQLKDKLHWSLIDFIVVSSIQNNGKR